MSAREGSSGSTRIRAILRRLGLLLSGALVVLLAVAVVGAAAWRPAATPAAIVASPISVGSGATSWVCAPAPALPTAGAGADIEYDPDLGTGGGRIATIVELTAIAPADPPSMLVGPLGEEGAEAGTSGSLATSSQPDVADPVTAVVEPTTDGVPLVAGVSVARADSGDLRGLSAATCQQPVTNAYLVGGATELGSSTRLVLANPGDTAASVTLSGWGATGPLTVAGAPIVVPAGGVRAVLLETISLESRLAVRIDVEGGRVVPTLQDSSLDGLIPSGTETIGVAADPATSITVPGVDLREDDGASAALRLVNPGDGPATVSVELLGAEGAEPLEGATDSVIEAGTVVDISLAGVSAGEYAVRVTSDEPVTGAVRMARTGTAGEDDPDTPPVDVAWLPAVGAVERGALPIPTQLVGTATVTVTNPGDAPSVVAVTAYSDAGEILAESTVELAAAVTAVVEIPDGTAAVTLEGDSILASALLSSSADDGPLIAASPVVGDPDVEQSVVVRVGS